MLTKLHRRAAWTCKRHRVAFPTQIVCCHWIRSWMHLIEKIGWNNFGARSTLSEGSAKNVFSFDMGNIFSPSPNNARASKLLNFWLLIALTSQVREFPFANELVSIYSLPRGYKHLNRHFHLLVSRSQNFTVIGKNF